MNFTAVDNKGTVDGFCLIKSVDKKISSKGDAYLDMILGDKEGEIIAKLWSYNENMHGVYEVNQIVKVRGTISVYNGKDQLRIDRIRRTNDDDCVSVEDFIKSATYDTAQMYDEIFKIAQNFNDSDLSLLVTTVLEENRLSMLYWPAAFKLHHAIRGGLLMHTLSVVRLAQSVCKIYPFVNEELLLAGAILHDIAKISEFEVSETGIATGYSVKGNLIGHLVEGAITVRGIAKRLGIDEHTAMLIEHMIISHHGEPEFGVAVRPLFIEAEMLSQLDALDAKMYEMRDAVSGVQNGEFTGKLWFLDDRKFYNTGKNDFEKEIKLF